MERGPLLHSVRRRGPHVDAREMHTERTNRYLAVALGIDPHLRGNETPPMSSIAENPTSTSSGRPNCAPMSGRFSRDATANRSPAIGRRDTENDCVRRRFRLPRDIPAAKAQVRARDRRL